MPSNIWLYFNLQEPHIGLSWRCLPLHKNSILFKTLDHLHHPDIEVLWVVVIGTVYHPPSADDLVILNYLITSLTAIEVLQPGCGVLLAGDLNRLNVNRLWFRSV